MKISILKANFAYLFLALLLSAAFLLTAYPFTYEQAVTRGFSDVIDYMAVANAPDLGLIHQYSLTHAMHRLERWPLHFFMGRLSPLFGINVWEIERVFVLFGMAAALVLIGSLRTGLSQKLAIYSLLIFTPYAFRQYYAVPGMLSDCFFYVAIVGLAVGMWEKRWALIVISICMACFLRQTGVLLLPLMVAFCFVEKIKLRKGVAVIALGLMSFGFSKFLSYIVFVPVSGGYVAMHTLGIFFWLTENPRWLDLIDFLGRYGLMLMTLSPMLLLINRLNYRDWMYVAFFFFLHTQPLLAGPAVSGSNVDRLAIYGLPFLGLLLIDGSNQVKWIGLFICLVFLESLLPNFSILHTITHPRYFFVSTVIMIFFISVIIKKNKSSSNNLMALGEGH